jgi:hypothetical protein
MDVKKRDEVVIPGSPFAQSKAVKTPGGPKKAMQHFDQHYLTQVIMAVITINGWNRIAISTQLQPGT